MGNATSRSAAVPVLAQLGFQCAEADNPYAAMLELCRRPLAYRALVLSLAGLYRDELQVIAAVKRRFPHVEVWLTQTDGRAASLAEANRAGADGLLSDEGLHPFATSAAAGQTLPPESVRPTVVSEPVSARPAPPQDPPAADVGPSEAVLTAEELRALLQDSAPARPGAVQQEG